MKNAFTGIIVDRNTGMIKRVIYPTCEANEKLADSAGRDAIEETHEIRLPGFNRNAKLEFFQRSDKR
jgi:hypothetical protein